MTTRRAFIFLLAAPLVAPLVAVAQTVISKFRTSGITFAVPDGWSVEEAPDKGAVYLLSPQVGDGHYASLLVELPQLAGSESIGEALRRVSTDLKTTTVDYQEHRLVTQSAGGRVKYGILEYAVTKFGGRLVEQYVLVPMSRSRRILVFTSTTEQTAGTRLLVFEKFLQSLHVPQ